MARWDSRELSRLLAINASPAQQLLHHHYGRYRSPFDDDAAGVAPAQIESCVRALLAAGADPWHILYDMQSVIYRAVVMQPNPAGFCPFEVLMEVTPERHDEIVIMRTAIGACSTTIAGIGNVARTARMTTILPAILLSRTQSFQCLNALETHIRAYAASEEEARAPDAQGNTPLHLVAHKSSQACFRTQIQFAGIIHALLCAGADPFAADAMGHTPCPRRRRGFRALEPVCDILSAAEVDVRERQLAMAMARHPRLGSGSPLALVSDDIFRAYIAPSRHCVPPTPRRGICTEYALRLAATLEADEGVNVCAEVESVVMQRDLVANYFEKCVRFMTPMTPRVRQWFRLLWAMHQAHVEVNAEWERRNWEPSSLFMIQVMRRIFLADGRLPPLSYWRRV